MDARKNGDANPFDNTLYCLEWIASAMDAARRHKERHENEPQHGDVEGFPSRPRAVPDAILSPARASAPDSIRGSTPKSVK